MDCLGWLLKALIANRILTENEKELYAQIFKDKADLYIMKYKIIDRTVYLAYVYADILKE